MQVGVIDLGTNTFHLLIARISEGRFGVLHKEKVPVEVGRGGINQGQITKPAYERAQNAMHHFEQLIKLHKVEEVVSTATSAFRNASNGPQLLEDIKKDTGITTTIIDGQDEASYIFEGVKHALKLTQEPSLIMDIGGGSVEFIIANQDKIYWKESFEIGVQRLWDRFQHQDPILAEEHQDMLNYLHQVLQPLEAAINTYKPNELIGSSGTFDTLYEIYRLQKQLNRHPEATEFELPIAELHALFERIILLNYDERLQIPGMIPMRADLITESSALIQTAMSIASVNRLRVSLFGLKEGILYSHFLIKSSKAAQPVDNNSNTLV